MPRELLPLKLCELVSTERCGSVRAGVDVADRTEVPKVFLRREEPVDVEGSSSQFRLAKKAREKDEERHSDVLILALPAALPLSPLPLPIPLLLLPNLQPLNQFLQIARLLRLLDPRVLEEVFCGGAREGVPLEAEGDELSEGLGELGTFEDWGRVFGNEEEDLRE